MVGGTISPFFYFPYLMGAALRKKIIWGVIALCAGSFAIKSCLDSQAAEQEHQEQKKFRQESVTPLLRAVNDATAPSSRP